MIASLSTSTVFAFEVKLSTRSLASLINVSKSAISSVYFLTLSANFIASIHSKITIIVAATEIIMSTVSPMQQKKALHPPLRFL